MSCLIGHLVLNNGAISFVQVYNIIFCFTILQQKLMVFGVKSTMSIVKEKRRVFYELHLVCATLSYTTKILSVSSIPPLLKCCMVLYYLHNNILNRTVKRPRGNDIRYTTHTF